MVKSIMIDGVDVSGCEFEISGLCQEYQDKFSENR